MSEPVARYPLAWPAARQRTPAHLRREHRFTHDSKPVTLSGAVDRLDRELERLKARYPILSTNVELRLDGRPRSGQAAPADPGACVYFELKGETIALACDTFRKVEGNVAALAAHIDALRAIERHGVATAAESLRAFAALPPPSQAPKPAASPPAAPDRPWREVLGLARDFPQDEATRRNAPELIRRHYRALASLAHPDVIGGSEAKMAELNQARDKGLEALK